jgi:hypothetical protein
MLHRAKLAIARGPSAFLLLYFRGPYRDRKSCTTNLSGDRCGPEFLGLPSRALDRSVSGAQEVPQRSPVGDFFEVQAPEQLRMLLKSVQMRERQ